MSDSGKAIFLSYASQDAAAAKRICEALRSSGVEVWFDAEGGLEHGDEWDAKIRRQIKECVLFIPLISANTEAREEGYFRIEWELAAQRALGIASGVAFILPVVIDDTAEAEALVPDRFHAVQWTRLRDGEVTPEVKQRFLKLWSHRSGVEKHRSREAPVAGVADPGGSSREKSPGSVTPAASSPRWLRPILASAVIVIAVLAYTLVARRGAEPPVPSAKPAPAVAPVSEAPALVAQAWAQLNKAELARAELEVADGLCRRATELEPNNVAAWAAWSQVDSWFVYHDFDDTATRRESARTKAARALQLAPQDYEARLAQACYLVRSPGGHGGTTSLFDAEAKQLLTALLQERPAEPRALLALGILQRNTGEGAAARATFEQLAANPAFAAQAWNEIGWAAFLVGDYRAAEAAADRSLALQPCWPNLVLKMILAESWTGDLDQAKEMLEKIPIAVRQEDHSVTAACQLYWYRREPQNMLRVLDGVARDWLRSNAFDGPKAFWAGLAQDMAGRPESARLQWEAALQQVEHRLAGQPDSARLLWLKGVLLANLGRRDEARKFFQLVRESGARATTLSARIDQAVEKILLGREDEALALLEKVDTDSTAAFYRVYPPFDPLRTNPRFQAIRTRLEADPRCSPRAPAATVPPAVDDKSVAVLAFANLSDDKANEYFSDGISEELLNVLAKVPGLKVSARTSAFYFKGREVPVPEIGRKLGVAYVVEGSVRKQGDKVRITAQLIKAADGFHVWSDTFTRDLKDIFAVQDEIAGLIAQNLSLTLGVNTGSAAVSVNPEAFELYVRARQAWNLRNEEGFARAEQLLHQALEIAPDFAPAHAALADVWYFQAVIKGVTGTFARPDPPEFGRVLAKIRETLALDPQSAEAYASLGLVMYSSWKFAESEQAFRRAIQLNPNYASARQWLAEVLGNEGRMDEALAESKLASELDPLSSRIADNRGFGLIVAGRYAEALACYERAIALQPSNLQAVGYKPIALAYLGRTDEAIALARALPPSLAVKPSVELSVYAMAGRLHEAEAMLPAARASGTVPPCYLLLLLGRKEEAIAALDPGSVDAPGNYQLIEYDQLDGDPRFQKFITTLGWTEARARMKAWRAAHPPEKPEPKP